jgi:hypothetical protein
MTAASRWRYWLILLAFVFFFSCLVVGVAAGYTPARYAAATTFFILNVVSWVQGLVRARAEVTPRRRRRRQHPPFRLLNRYAKALWSAKTYDRVFKPVIADIHHEWSDARRRHEDFRAWWIRHVRGRYAILQVAWHQLPWSLWSGVKKLIHLMFTLTK